VVNSGFPSLTVAESGVKFWLPVFHAWAFWTHGTKSFLSCAFCSGISFKKLDDGDWSCMSELTQREVAAFNGARRLPASERAAYLDEACAGEAAMRQRLDELLQVSESAAAFLDQPAQGDLGKAAMQGEMLPGAIPLSEKPGDKIGRYKLFEMIGEGGCGVVYVAEQIEPVRRRVALKVISWAWTPGRSSSASRPSGRRWP
jgi:hypothetical protein